MCRACAGVVAVLGLPAAGPAQTTLEVVVTQQAGPHYVARVDPDGLRVLSVRTLTAEERDWGRGLASSDGRFLAGITTEILTQFQEPVYVYSLTIHDLVSGDTLRIPRGHDVPVVAMHPRRTEIVWSDSVGPKVLGLAGERRLGGCAYGNVGQLSADGARAVFQCPGSVSYTVVDVDAGGVVADLGVSYGAWPILNANGLDAYDFDGAALRRRAVQSGAELGRAAIPGEDPVSHKTLQVDSRTGDVFVVGNGLHVVDGVTMALERSQPTLWSGAAVGSWLIDAERPRLYAITYEGGRPVFVVLDSDTLQVLSRTPIPGSATLAVLRRVPTPGVPTALAATVQGSSVALSWGEGAPVGQPLRYVLEVGSAPGLNDIIGGLDVGLQTSFAASGVPSGTYYVRVRAGNYAGLSAPSNEVVVTVP